MERLGTPEEEEYPIPLGRREVWHIIIWILTRFNNNVIKKGTALNVALNLEGTCLCASGTEVPVEVSITKFWVHRDSPATVVCLLRDIHFVEIDYRERVLLYLILVRYVN